ncbi:PREDICTED: apoptosis-associated speck-like protein containing a CARD [Thamnophis sirtalis]|uniref:Apoptosis-associated speck-like protein containing a CARD n=1 Tax=Thamnophis sirtalis TaxID=35019 RepID=A0A6I9X2I7_9SAUR|nr:PREDICTED: apoptosis-associated speck-like protein containing a CARD [Thamnophis sirtalis]
MPKSMRGCLEETLEDLTEVELRNFKANLHEFPVKQGYDNIPRGRLQKADALDLSDLLVSFYEGYALEVTAAVLRLSHCNPQANKLETLSGIGNGPSSRPSSSPDQHFIDQFREQLIQRTVTVEQVLDKLHGSIINEGQYQQICSRETNQAKMRELYKLVPGWNLECKDQFYKALKAIHPFLIKDLEGR